ncbi:MAG: selenium metabolism-associated LysR family transcriptional regulator [Syntrophales bacterium]
MSYDSFKNITLQQLESLISLVETGSFTKAAAGVFLTQSSLTKQMQNLEEAVGTRLVNRGGAGIFLTPEGKVLYDYARRVIRLREEAKERVEQLRNQDSGHIYVAASTTPATYLLPQLLKHLQQNYLDIRLHIKMQDSDEVLQTILNSQAEIGFVGKETSNKKIVGERLVKDRLVLVVPPQHPLAAQKSVTMEALSRQPFVAREHGSGTRAIMEGFLQQNYGVRLPGFNIVCEVGSTEAAKEAILAGLGVSILSVFAVHRELQQGLLLKVDIVGCLMERYFYLIYRKNFPFRKHHQHFLEVIRKTAPFLSVP